jgi:hypothetical protein
VEGVCFGNPIKGDCGGIVPIKNSYMVSGVEDHFYPAPEMPVLVVVIVSLPVRARFAKYKLSVEEIPVPSKPCNKAHLGPVGGYGSCDNSLAQNRNYKHQEENDSGNGDPHDDNVPLGHKRRSHIDHEQGARKDFLAKEVVLPQRHRESGV